MAFDVPADLRGGAFVRPRANRPGPLAWFHNGAPGCLVLPPGAHEPRCVDPSGESAAVRVSVRDGDGGSNRGCFLE